METQQEHERALLEKMRELPPELRSEVEDFVDFLRGRSRDQSDAAGFSKLSEAAFQRVWDNPEDAVYDDL